MHFPSVSDFPPPISGKFVGLRRKFSHFHLFQKDFFNFQTAKISADLFLVIDSHNARRPTGRPWCWMLLICQKHSQWKFTLSHWFTNIHLHVHIKAIYVSKCRHACMSFKFYFHFHTALSEWIFNPSLYQNEGKKQIECWGWNEVGFNKHSTANFEIGCSIASASIAIK